MLIDQNFLRGISLEENPFEEEAPDEIRFFDFSGQEVTIHEAE